MQIFLSVLLCFLLFQDCILPIREQKQKEYSSNDNYKTTLYNYQLEIPLLFIYKIPINDKLNLKPQIGAYVEYGLFEITNWKRDYINTNSQPDEGTYSSYFYDSPFGLLYGANVGISTFYNKYSFTLSCDISSISRLRKYPDICLFFSLGYNF